MKDLEVLVEWPGPRDPLASPSHSRLLGRALPGSVGAGLSQCRAGLVALKLLLCLLSLPRCLVVGSLQTSA